MGRFLFADKQFNDKSNIEYYILEEENKGGFSYGVCVSKQDCENGILYSQEKSIHDITNKKEEILCIAKSISENTVLPEEAEEFLKINNG